MKNVKSDIFIKDEGHADINFLTDKAKEVAFDLGLVNSLRDFETFCGKKVWNMLTRKGLYKYACSWNEAMKLCKVFEGQGLKVV